MKFLLAAGGSGGHIYPGLAIMEAVREEDPSSVFFWVGTVNSQESKLAKKKGIPYLAVRANSVNNEGILWRIKAFWVHGRMTLRVMNLIRKEKIQAIITTGGYATASTLMAAALMRKPIFMHEQNVFPGMGTRLFARFARKVFTSFPGTEKHLRGNEAKVQLVGNPVREDLLLLDRNAIRDQMQLQDKLLVVSLGGSLGANSLNDFILELKPLIEGRDDLRWIHVYGDDAGEKYDGLYQSIKNLEAHRYLQDFPPYLVASDLLITRSGAGMLTELSALGRASILIPSPNVLDDHQSFNARFFEAQGGATILLDEELKTSKAVKLVEELLNDQQRRDSLAKKSKGILPEDAAKNIAEEILGSL